MTRWRILGVLMVLATGCRSTEVTPVEVKPERGGRLADVSTADGPTPEQMKPLEIGNDRTDELLSYPTLPAGEVRFRRTKFDGAQSTTSETKRPRPTPVRCEIDRDCTNGDVCLRPAGAPALGGGVCGRAHGEPGATDKDKIRSVRSCKQDWECPEKFACVPVSGPFGICIRFEGN